MSTIKKTVELTGKTYWQSLKEISDNPDIQELLQSEDIDEKKGFSRRDFLGLMGASIALAGLSGCRRPVEKIIPYIVAPEEIIPGVPNFYATSMQRGLDAIGFVIENHEGRPTKIEGNKKHPSSLGKTDSFAQAEILNLYDPDRSKNVLHNGAPSVIQDFITAWSKLYDKYNDNYGEGLTVISEVSVAPTFTRLKKEFHRTFPKAKWVAYNPISDENIVKGSEIAFGKATIPIYNFEKAQVIVALDSDFLFLESGSVKNSMGFANGRRVTSEHDTMNRLYVAESSMSVTGGMADHRIKLKNSDIVNFAMAIAIELKEQGIDVKGIDSFASNLNFDKNFVKELVVDLINNRGESLVVAGRTQPANVHVLVNAINYALGNLGKTVTLNNIEKDLLPNNDDLVDLIKSSDTSTLISIGINPVYSTPKSLQFEKFLNNIEHTIQLSSHVDETSEHVEWHLNQSHFLEEWNDTQASDGTSGITQPQILPLFNGLSNIELLGIMINNDLIKGYDLVQNTWKNILSTYFDNKWNTILHDGIYSKKINSSQNALVNNKRINNYLVANTQSNNNEIELVLKPSASTFDGSFANNGWMQEMPNPVSKLTWDNAAQMSHRTAKLLGVKNEDLVKISNADDFVLLPVWILPGQADNSISVELGYGRSKVGRIGNLVGQNTYKMMNSSGNYLVKNISISKGGATYSLACTQDSHGMNDDKLADDAIQERLPMLIREANLDEYRHHPEFAKHAVHHPPLKSLWEEFDYNESPQWGMTIDLNVCTGCNACSTACQSENNIPVIGKQEVRMGREMHWIRLDRYFSGDPDEPEVVIQPVACQHCEMAPCEQVCPVAATTHSEDGLNGMTYNRCVGTRYCANNCPYKVRRFNFFNFTKDMPEIVQMARNPDVTVRFRGVMEKCTYCVQRINSAKIQAKNEKRDIQDGDVVTACQQVCPTDAITFGNILDPDSEVSNTWQNNRNYALLGELNTKPRTLYQARLRNPNPKLEEHHS
ncbi:MAG: TAT-variant-translocated molybdopterin oxidoreductase [Candidatus Neomarinimicrobiota bacterium]